MGKATVYQDILRGEKSYNRGIRYRRLTPTELDQLELKAAKLLTMEPQADPATRYERLRQIRLNEGVKTMLVAVTKNEVPIPPRPPLPPKEPDGTQPPAPAPEEPELADPALWVDVNVGLLTLPGDLNYDEIFSGVDHDLLKLIFSWNHESNPIHADAIVKKERTVSPVAAPTGSAPSTGTVTPTVGGGAPSSASKEARTSTGSSGGTPRPTR